MIALALAVLGSLPAQLVEPAVVARSERGGALARVVPAARRPGALELEVVLLGERGERPLWRAPWAARSGAFESILTETGEALVLFVPRFAPEGELLELWRGGRRIAALDADALGLTGEVDAEGRWIAPAWDTTRLRAISFGQGRGQVLDLLTVTGELLTLDLSNGWVERSESLLLPQGASATIEPPLPPEVAAHAIEPYVERLDAPSSGVLGAPLELELRGAFPTPGWAIVGYTLEEHRLEDGALELLVRPWASRLGGGPTAQVITHYRTKATLVVHESGTHRLIARGRPGEEEPEPKLVQVVPRRLAVALEIEAGAGTQPQRIELLSDGRWRLDGEARLASEPAFARVAEALALLPARSARARTPFGAEGARYRLEWVAQGEARSAELDELSLEGPWKRLVEALVALRSDRPPRPPRWSVLADEGRLVARTRSSGLLKGLGHEHEVSAVARSGSLLFDPERPGEARLELEVLARSLLPLEEADREEVRVTMLEKVLEAARHPRIAYVTRRIDAKDLGDGRFEAVLHGDLELHGLRKPLVIGARVVLEGERLVASGRCALRLSEFGMQAPKAPLGTVNVADEVGIEFELVLRREP